MIHRTRAWIDRIFRFFLAASTAMVVGCAENTYEKQYYMLDALRSGEPVASQVDATLAVRRFSVDMAFAGRNMVYRLGDLQYESDYYHEFLVAPGIIISEKTRDWLAASGLFKAVLPVGSGIEPTYTLLGGVTTLYGDFTKESAPSAVIEIRFFLLGRSRHNVIFSQTYRAARDIPTRTADDFAAALNQDLVEILTRLEADLHTALTKPPGQAGRVDNSAN